MTGNSQWTLVQHTGFAITNHEEFRNAVETRSITAAQAKRVEEIGGLVFNSYTEATEGEEKTNYPPDTIGFALIPRAQGAFSRTVQIDGLGVFVPTAMVAL